jgi:hypothetical protein
MATLADRFNAFVERSGTHRLWLGATDRNGVPQMRVDGLLTTARRVAWELERGPLPHNLRIRGCTVDSRCVRVEHLAPIAHRQAHARVRRTRGQGSMREVRAGVWQLTVTITTGHRTFRTVHGGHSDAERELARLATEHGHAPTTLDALIAAHHAHLASLGRRASTIRRYQQLWTTWLAPTLGNVPPTELHQNDVERALAAMAQEGQGDRSIHQAAVVLNTAYAWARTQGLTRRNPVIGCELPNGEKLTASRRR